MLRCIKCNSVGHGILLLHTQQCLRNLLYYPNKELYFYLYFYVFSCKIEKKQISGKERAESMFAFIATTKY